MGIFEVMANHKTKTDLPESDNDLKPRNEPYNRHREKNSWLEEYLEDTEEAAKEIEDWLHDRGLKNGI
jgi:hypothetical protein